MSLHTVTTLGRELEVGDAILATKIHSTTKRIIEMAAHPDRPGDQIARFDVGLGMTIEPNGRYARAISSKEKLNYVVSDLRVVSIGFRSKRNAKDAASRWANETGLTSWVEYLTPEHARKIAITVEHWDALTGGGIEAAEQQDLFLEGRA